MISLLLDRGRRTVAIAATFLTVLALTVGLFPLDSARANAVVPTGPAAATSIAETAGPVKAADLSQFRPGNIVSDAVFFDRNTMTEAQIQSFLEQRVPRCESGYTCLKDWYDTSRTTSADAMCGAYAGGTRERASRIIYKVAQACGINPQVILVTLQKEQGLVTHVWPSEWRYTAAMGQGCPDTAACDSRYYGFFNQVYGAAWQLKRYANPPGTSQYFTWYAPGKSWNILYNPNRNCGSSSVYVENQATSNLYYYTPYQPNAAAIRAGYGTGDGCSAYGNRNFFNYFTDWFGSTQQPVNACAQPADRDVTAASGLYVTVSQAVNARQAPTTDCGDGVVSVPAETLVVRTGTYEGWTRISQEGARGWIRSDLLVPLSSTPAPSFELDDTRHIFGLSSAGDVLAYPFSRVGRWGAAVTVSSGQGLSQLVSVGDLDGDGHRDLAARDTGGGAVLLRGDGSAFSAPQSLAIDWTGARLISGAGDFDGDTNPDAFAIDAGGSLTLWRGDGAGSFGTPTVIGRGWGSMTAIAGGSDLSGDGLPDLIARSSAGTLHLYRGDGGGGWAGSAQIGRGWSGMTALVMPGDFTGDGKPDLLARTAGGALSLYGGTGSGLALMGQVGTGWSSMASVVGPGMPITPTQRPVVSPGVGDFSGDGNPDVVAIAGTQLILYRGNGAGGWAGSVTLASDWPSGARLIAMGDFDGDGSRDLGRIGADGQFWLLPGTPAGDIGTPRRIGTGWSGMDAVIGGVDADADGNADVIARSTSGTLRLYRGNGAGAWSESGRVLAEGWDRYDRLANVGDFDGDLLPDILVRDRASGALWLQSADVSSTWPAPRQIGRGWGGFLHLVGSGDFDGDGNADVLATTASGELHLYRGNGSGGWAGNGQIGRGWASISQIV